MANTKMFEFKHPNYYKNLRKLARLRNRDQAISLQASTEAHGRTPGTGPKPQASSSKQQAPSNKRQAASFKPQAPSDSSQELQASSPKQQASSSKP